MDLQELEKIRIEYNAKKHEISKKFWIVAGIIFAACFVLSLIPTSQYGFKGLAMQFLLSFINPIFIIMAIIAYFVIVSISTREMRANYRKLYKAYFIEKTLKSVFTDIRYDHGYGIDRNVLAETGMVNTGNLYSSNDFTIGKYKDVAFEQADVKIQEEHTDSDGDTYYVTTFCGRFMMFEFPKKFNFRLELIGKKFGASATRINRSDKTKLKTQEIKTESVEFNKLFKIIAEDGFEAYYILDPAFMEKIQSIAELYNHKVLFGFFDNKLLVGLNDGNDSFEPPKNLSKPINEQEELAKVKGEIKVITDFVDVLKLDNKLFK